MSLWHTDQTEFEVEMPDGAIIRGQRAGSGPKVVAIHGWTQTRANWEWVGGNLLEAGYEVITFDLRGHGASTKGTLAPAVVELRDDLRRVFDHQEIDSATVVGHSLGGTTAMSFGITGDERLAGLVIVASSAKYASPDFIQPAARAFSQLLHPRFSGPATDDFRVARWTARPALGKNPPRWAWDHTTELAMATPAEITHAQFVEIRKTNILDLLPMIAVPTTVIGGTRDLLTPPLHSEAIHQGIPGSKLVMLPDSGHMVMLERVPEVTAEVLAMVAEVSPSMA